MEEREVTSWSNAFAAPCFRGDLPSGLVGAITCWQTAAVCHRNRQGINRRAHYTLHGSACFELVAGQALLTCSTSPLADLKRTSWSCSSLPGIRTASNSKRKRRARLRDASVIKQGCAHARAACARLPRMTLRGVDSPRSLLSRST